MDVWHREGEALGASQCSLRHTEAEMWRQRCSSVQHARGGGGRGSRLLTVAGVCGLKREANSWTKSYSTGAQRMAVKALTVK